MLTTVGTWAKIVKFHNFPLFQVWCSTFYITSIIIWSLLSKKGDGSIVIVHFNKFYL
jgi:hypothetical protein